MTTFQKVRIGGFVVLAVLALVVVLAVEDGSAEPPVVNVSGATTRAGIDAALADFEANDLLTDSAPQQSVAAAWAAKDLLAVVAEGQAEELDAIAEVAAATEPAAPDGRLAPLVLLGILAVCWFGATLREPASRPNLEPPMPAPRTGASDG